MRSLPLILGIFAASLLGSVAQEAADPAEVDAQVVELREAISKLVDVQTLESKERHDWAAKKAAFTNLLELHQRELKLLDEELAKAGKTAPVHEEQTAEMEAEIEALKEARRLTSEAVARNKRRMDRLTPLFPLPLIDDMQDELTVLRMHGPEDEPREALMAMLGIIDKAEQFNRRFTRSIERGKDQEVEKLYLGLAQAYALGRDGYAGYGKSTMDGWEWTDAPEIAGALKEIFEIMDKKRPPATVTLPLKLD